MANVVLLITLAAGLIANSQLGTADDKASALSLLRDKVGQIYDEDIKNVCSRPVYEFKDGEHIFSCNLSDMNGGRKSRRTRKSRKTRRLRKDKK
jgi:hypothetical protein